MLNLVDPVIDWVSFVQSMGIEKHCPDTAAGFAGTLASALEAGNPYLFETQI